MLDFALVLLRSTRAKAVLFAIVSALFKKYFPDAMPDETTMQWLYGLVIAFIAGDTVRPIDPDKPNMMGQ